MMLFEFIPKMLRSVMAHKRTSFIMDQAMCVVRDTTLRCKVEDVDTMTKAVDKAALSLTDTYLKVSAKYTEGEVTETLEISDMDKEALSDMKRELSKQVSKIDKLLQEDTGK